MTEDKPGVWVWCLHCQRYYRLGEYRLVHGLRLCPYPGCDGDTDLDAYEYPDLPFEPERGKFYTYGGVLG